ncbi:conserved hypothetical protein [Aeropyrum pernix]|uniref:Calcineurin-like phosphoesterase domain-containing protein n=1 Tax=Aeropyrum pernix TaxID=56636 RepID=A0A401H7D4_AERPX|nr:metallophosphoesterase family protein [Aeropyrum pernix]GBF08314.1 conserved hypothetical protein [Aeropyrum pernix]
MDGSVILHVSDIHCSLRRLEDIISSLPVKPSTVAATGDFECEKAAVAIVEWSRREGVPLVAVTGNLDHAGVRRVLRSAGVLMDGRVDRVGGLVFGGVGGMDPRTSMEMLLRSLETSGLTVDVLLTHHPPHGVLDTTFAGVRAGLHDLRSLVDSLKPRAHLFGHIHESPGIESIGGTVFINPGPAYEGRYALVRILGSVVKAELYTA